MSENREVVPRKASGLHWFDVAALGAGLGLYWIVVGMVDAAGTNTNGERFCLWHPVIAGAVLGLVIAATAGMRAGDSSK